MEDTLPLTLQILIGPSMNTLPRNSDSKFGSESDQFDVMVVGYGPVGAAMATLLGRHGIRTLVIDKMTDILLMPRAIALDNEALRILQMTGLTDQSFARIGIQEVKMHCPYIGQFSRVNTSGTIDGHPKLVTFYQPELEQALRDQVAEYSCVRVRTGYELLHLQQNNHGVTARIADANGNEQTVSARYLIGADGASSTVRSLIGQDFKGQTYSEDWLIVDANQRENKAIDHVEFNCDPKRPTPHMPAPGGRERWEFMLQAGETATEMEQPEKLAELLSPWLSSEELTIERQAVYRFHARCCSRFQVDQTFLVGDAAHITPPFVGQGLVAGLRDVANLGWKLAWVIKGHAQPHILKSYDQERRPHANQMINLAKMMGKLVMPRNKPRAMAIHGMMRAINAIPPARSYVEDLKIKPANRFKKGLFKPEAGPDNLTGGTQLPQDFVLKDNRIQLSDDALGDALTLVGLGVDPCQHLDSATQQAWQAAGGQFLHLGMRGQTNSGLAPFAECLGNGLLPGAPEGWLVVVRPDRVIMHSGQPSQANAMISESLNMLQSENMSILTAFTLKQQLRQRYPRGKGISHPRP